MDTSIKKCPECSSVSMFYNKDKGEVICKDCGLVIEDKMVDFGQEWQDFEDGDESSGRRAGAPMTYTKHDQGLGTEVGRAGDLYVVMHVKSHPVFKRKGQDLFIDFKINLATAILGGKIEINSIDQSY